MGWKSLFSRGSWVPEMGTTVVLVRCGRKCLFQIGKEEITLATGETWIAQGQIA